MKTVLLIGTLDTKNKEYQYVREKVEAEGVRCLLMDVSCKQFRPEYASDISSQEEARTANSDFASVSEVSRA